jgi:hypothetical protein
MHPALCSSAHAVAPIASSCSRVFDKHCEAVWYCRRDLMPPLNLAIELTFCARISLLISYIIRFLKKLWLNKGGGTFAQVLYCALLAFAYIEMLRALISRGADANSMTWEEIEAAAQMQVSLFVGRLCSTCVSCVVPFVFSHLDGNTVITRETLMYASSGKRSGLCGQRHR